MRSRVFLVLAVLASALVGLVLLVTRGGTTEVTEPGELGPRSTQTDSVKNPVRGQQGVETQEGSGRARIAAPGETLSVASTALQSLQRQLVVRIVDISQEPIADAACRIDDHQAEPITQTDATGTAILQINGTDEFVMIVDHPRFAKQVRRIESPAPQSIVIVLQPRARIVGRVSRRSDGTPVAGAVIAAFPTGTIYCDHDFALEATRGSPRQFSAVSGADGAFEIDGLAAGSRYRLVSGRPGLVSTGLVETEAQIAPAPVDLGLSPMYGVAIDLLASRDESGVIAMGPDTSFRLSTESCPAWNDAKSVPNWLALLAGIPMESARSVQGRHYVFLKSLDEDVDRFGPLRFQLGLPGYAPVDAEIWLYPTDDGIPAIQIPLMSDGVPLGAVDIELRNLPPRAKYVRPAWPYGRVILSGGTGSVQCAIESLANDRVRVQGIPFGTYSARFLSTSGGFDWPRSESENPEIQIGESPANFVVDFAGTATWEVTVDGRAGTPYSGYLGLFLEFKRPYADRVQTIYFNSPPYLLVGLPPATYSLRLMFPADAAALLGDAAETEFTVDDTGAGVVRFQPNW